MIKIYKASAGSGKTYTLSHTYIDLLLQSGRSNAYRNILAVTFTNKATAEMKDRILANLFEMGEKDPKIRELLVKLLHDYGAFSVSTIDKFFQQALRSFSREIGQSNDYQVELDQDSLVREAVDRILDEIGEDDSGLLNWFEAEIDDKLNKGESFRLGDKLYEFCNKLCAEDYSRLVEERGLDINTINSPERLKSVLRCCREYFKNFEGALYAAAKNIDPDIINSNKTLASSLKPYLDRNALKKDIPLPNKTMLAKLEGTDFLNLLTGKEMARYRNLKHVEKSCFDMGMSPLFFKKFKEIQKEKNVLSLGRSGSILKDIIDGSDTPFVYEKMGVRYEHFLLDEFQDTSYVQWENFYPLLKESNDNCHDNLIVGDPKQSIYRFRNSDWKLLEYTLPENFQGECDIKALQHNYRSNRAIVKFNNMIFKQLAKAMELEELYADCEQEVAVKDPQEGYVDIFEAEDRSDEGRRVLVAIKEALLHGAMPSDIAVLVRKNKQGAEIAQLLLENGFDVISDDSLLFTSSDIINKLVALLYKRISPENGLKKYAARDLDVDLEKSYSSLVDYCDSLFQKLKELFPEEFEHQQLFVQSFMDMVLAWSQKYGNDISSFLQYWENKKGSLALSCPENPNAIRIMTVHKAKGLAFNVLIFPFAGEDPLFDSLRTEKWCHYSDETSPEIENVYPIKLNKKSSSNSSFDKDYLEEAKAQAIDNLNLFYVCLTRAKKEMYIITCPTSSKQKSISKVLHECLCKEFGTEKIFLRLGSEYDFSKMKREQERKTPDFEAGYDSYPMNPDPEKERFSCSDDAFDFFSEEGVGQSARLNGICLHKILSRVEKAEDLPASLQRAVDEGLLAEEEREQAAALLEKGIAAHPQWFGGARKILNEADIIGENGSIYRPDRVVIKDNEVLVIDFKFGEEKPQYHKQVAQYVRLFRKMGYKNVSGHIWYVREDKVQSVN